MSLGHGTSIARNGLVLYYDISNTQKSWRGAPTVNLLTNPDFASGSTGYSAYVSTAPTTVTVTDFPGSIGIPKTVLECTSAAAPGGGGNSGGMAFTNPTLTTGLAYTISFWARILSHSSATNTFSNQSGSGDNSNFAFTRTITSDWTRYSYTTSSLDLMKSVWYVWTNLNSARWQYADFQIEQSTFATPFVSGTRSNTQSILDLVGSNTLTATSLTYASNNTFSFDGTTSYIGTNIVPNKNEGSVSAWFNMTTLRDFNTIFDNALGANDWECWVYANGTITFRTNADSTDSRLDVAGLAANTWYNVVVTWTATDARMYINGVLSNTDSTVGTRVQPTQLGIGGANAGNTKMSGQIPNFAVYNRALTAAEVRQNFEALRGRYGI